MINLICGSCAQDKQLPLEDRMELAMARVPGQLYVCDCGRVHPDPATNYFTRHMHVLPKREIKPVIFKNQLELFTAEDHITFRG